MGTTDTTPEEERDEVDLALVKLQEKADALDTIVSTLNLKGIRDGNRAPVSANTAVAVAGALADSFNRSTEFEKNARGLLKQLL